MSAPTEFTPPGARVEEGHVDVPGGRVWWRSVGDGDGLPLLCLHGGPGAPHDYLEPLEQLGDHRRVVFYDQLGCGNSPSPDDKSLFTVERFVEEVDAVRDGLELERTHLFGSSWGGMLAMQYTLDRPRKPQSLVMAGSPASSPRWNEICSELLAELPDEERAQIERIEAEGKEGTPEYEEALLPFYKRHVCRLDPWPEYVVRAFDRIATNVYHYMAGPSEFRIVGTLRTWDIMDRLGEITIPTLVTGGEYDECRPVHLREIHERIPGSELHVVAGGSHLCFAERPEDWMPVVRDFLDRAEAGGR